MRRKCVLPIAFLFWAGSSALAHATHIQYVDLADITVNQDGISNVRISANTSWTWEFDLLTDSMYLWELDTPTSTSGGPTPDVTTADYRGAYDPDSPLHYMYLRIDPNSYNLPPQGPAEPTSVYVKLEVNGIKVDDWSNPILLYDWGVPGGTISDNYGIAASSYTVTVTLTGLASLGNKTIDISNVNLEGCFDSAVPIPEPASVFLLGSGLAGLAGGIMRKRRDQGTDENSDSRATSS